MFMSSGHLYRITYECQRCGRHVISGRSSSPEALRSHIPVCVICHRQLCRKCTKYGLCVDDYDALPPDVHAVVQKKAGEANRKTLLAALIPIVGAIMAIYGGYLMGQPSGDYQFQTYLSIEMGGLGIFVFGILLTICMKLKGVYNAGKSIGTYLLGQGVFGSQGPSIANQLSIQPPSADVSIASGNAFKFDLHPEKTTESPTKPEPKKSSKEIIEEMLTNTPQTKKCPDCSENLPEDAAFCNRCGYKFKD